MEHLKQNPMFRVGLDVFEVKKLTSISNLAKPPPKLIHDCIIGVVLG